MNKSNIPKLKKAFKKLNEAIEGASLEYRKELAGEIFKSLVLMSPVSTGSYVCSHRIGIGTPDTTVVVKHGVAGNKDAMRQEALGQLADLSGARPFSPIFISNRIPHAVNVEYTGWERTPPYHVYGLTHEHFRLREKEIMKKIGVKLQAKVRSI